MANMASFTMKMTGSNKTLKEVLNLLSAASDEDGWLIPSSILPVDPDEQPKWICFYGPEEWEGDTTAVISGEGKHSPPDAMVRELSLRYPDVLFEVGYNIEYFHEGSFEFSNGVFSEIDYLEEMDFRDEVYNGEYHCYMLDGKLLDPPEIIDGDYLRWGNTGPQEQEQEEEILQYIPVLNAADATAETAVLEEELQGVLGWSQPKVSRVLTRLQRKHTVSSKWSGEGLYWREKLLQHN